MKLTRLLLLLFASMMVMSCSNDDDDKELEKTTDDLIYTSWKGEYTIVGDSGKVGHRNVILQFLTPKTGQYIILDDDGNPLYPGLNDLWYDFSGPVITFNGALTGRWTITKKTHKRLRLEAYTPYQETLELEKIF
ncbi:MAG: hypothetical protein HFJ95_09500 [Muribaculaceae bacterium]|nr:hypothetical protein [Muribaculaceae bacterium]